MHRAVFRRCSLHGGLFFVKDCTYALIDNLIHQFDQIALLVCLLVLLGKLLDDLVDEFAEGVGVLVASLATLVQKLKELTHVLFAVLIRVWQVDQRQRPDKYLHALCDCLLLQLCVEEELFEHSYGGQTEVSIAEGDKEVVLHLGEDLMPLIQVTRSNIRLRASIKYLDVRPLETL